MGLDISIQRDDDEVIYLRKCYEVREWAMERLAREEDWLQEAMKNDGDFAYTLCPIEGPLSTEDMLYIRDKCAEHLRDIDLNHLVKNEERDFNNWQILYTYMVIQRLRPDLCPAKWLYRDTG